MTTSWQDRLSRTEKVLVDRDLAVKEYGLALRVESEAPHFVSLNDNPLSTGVTLYTLSPGITHVRWGAMRVRSSSAAVTSGTPSSGDDVPAEDALFPSDMPQNPEGMNPAAVILLDGVGIDRDHCYIAAETDTVTLHPVSEMCFVNGNQVTEPTELHQGDTVELGESYLWRFNNPIEAAKLKKTGALRPTVRSLMSPRRDSSRSLSGNLPALAASSASVSGSSQPNSPGPQSSVLGLQSPASSIPEPSTPSKPAVSVQHASTSPMRDAASSSASSLTSAVGAEQAPQALPQIDFSPSEPGDFELEAERHRNPNYLPPMPFDEAGSLFPTISAELIRRARAESMLDLPKSTTTDRARADSVVDLQQHAESTEHLNLMSSSFGDDMNLLDESLDLIDDDDAFSKELEDEFEEEPSSTIEATNDSPVVRDGTSSAYTEGDTTLLGDDEVSLDDADEQHEQLEQAHADADADADADAEGQRSQSLSMTLDGELAPEVEGSVATSDSLLLSDDHMLIDVQQPSGAEDVVLPSGDVQDVAVSSLAAAAAAISRPEELQVSTETVDTNVPAQHHDLLDTSSLIELLHQVDESSVLSQHIVNTTVAVDESASAPAVASSELPADAVLPSATDSTVSQLGTSHQNTSAAPELDGEPVLAEEVDSLAASTLTTSEGHAPPTVEPSATAEHANDMSSSDVADLIQNKIDGLCSQLAAEQSDLPADEGEQLMHELVQLRFRLFEIQQAQAEGGSPTDDGLQSLPPPLTPAQPSFSRVSELQAVTQQLEDAKAQLAALDQALASPTDRRNSRVAETDRALLAEMLHKLELRQSKLKAERTLEHEQILQLTQNLEQRVGELRNRGAASSSAGVGATSAAALLERPRADSGSHAATAPASPAPASATATVSASSKDEQVVEAAAISVLERCSVYISIPQAVEKIEVGSDHKESRFHFYIVRIRVGDNVWDLQRRYSQFREFHLAIRSKFPSGVKIMFPPRKTIGHRNPDFVERRRIRLESYLRCAIAAFLTEPLSPIADNPSKQTMQAEIPFLRP
ncbi:kinesin family member 1C, variant [Capsaspora owczarzaki ATCC 30864]|nr:kinesin family member 1C, variant [Capsaspora owczarzaki ATCC 30864]